MGQIKYILLTGSNGFLGSFVLRRLLETGYKPILYLRNYANTWRINEYLDQCQIFRSAGSEQEIKDLFESFEIDCILHLATDYGRNKSLTELLQTNILFPIALIDEGVKHGLKLFVNTDSFFAKQDFKQQYLKDYTNSKRALEKLLQSYDEKLKIANLRIEHVYGENDSSGKFFTSIIKSLLKNEPFIELTKGEQKRDFVYAKDVANSYISIIENLDKLKDFQEFEVGTGKSTSLRTFVERISAVVGSKTELRFGALPTRVGDIQDSFANLENLKSIGWRQEYTIEDAMDYIIKKEKIRL